MISCPGITYLSNPVPNVNTYSLPAKHCFWLPAAECAEDGEVEHTHSTLLNFWGAGGTKVTFLHAWI